MFTTRYFLPESCVLNLSGEMRCVCCDLFLLGINWGPRAVDSFWLTREWFISSRCLKIDILGVIAETHKRVAERSFCMGGPRDDMRWAARSAFKLWIHIQTWECILIAVKPRGLFGRSYLSGAFFCFSFLSQKNTEYNGISSSLRVLKTFCNSLKITDTRDGSETTGVATRTGSAVPLYSFPCYTGHLSLLICARSYLSRRNFLVSKTYIP